MLILGVRVVSGEYNGKAFENAYITFEKERSKESAYEGTCCEVVKIKGSVLSKQLNKLNISLAELVGQDFEVSYDRFGNPAYLI